MCTRSFKKLNAVFSALMLAALPLVFAACKKPCDEPTVMLSTVSPISAGEQVTVPTSHADTSKNGIDTYIILNNENTTINGEGASFSDSVLTISKGGSYLLKGRLSDGKIVVDLKEAGGRVFLRLGGITVRSSSDSPLSITSSNGETHIVLEENTVNELSDTSGESVRFKKDREKEYTPAVIFGKSNILLEGDGTLKITAKYKKGIYSERELEVLGGNIDIESANDALGAKNSIAFKGGTLDAVSGAQGIRTGKSDAGKGSIYISGGSLKIESALDCIQSASNLTVTGGTFDLSSGGGSTGKAEKKGHTNDLPRVKSSIVSSGEQTIDVNESKAVRAEKSITVSNGDFAVNSLDDAFYSGEKIHISDGNFDIKTDSNAFYSSSRISVSGGNIKVDYCAEGVEGKDVSISGGSIYINTEGSGFGEKGSVLQTGGTVVAFGAKSGVNGKSSYTVTGGTVLCGGDLPARKATVRRNAELSVTATFPANTLFAVTDEGGKTLFCLSIPQNSKSIWFSSSDLSIGDRYKIYSGGINTGVSKNGIYYGSNYTPGWLVDTVTAK